jgi:ubiquinone/menaquinone biosynthesis C-methylase UbiE
MFEIKNPVFNPHFLCDKNVSSGLPAANAFLEMAMQNVFELYWYHPLSEMLSRLDGSTNSFVLDIGFYHGLSTAWLMIASGAERVNAIDISSRTATMLKQLLYSVKPDVEISILESSAESLPYRDNTFDIIFCRSVLQYTDTEKVCREIRRVLRPEGKGFIIANMSENLFIRLYRKIIGSRKELQFGEVKGYLSIDLISIWTEERWCKFHKEYHLFTPLLFPVIERLSSGVLKRIVFFSLAYFDSLCFRLFPFLNRYSWLAFLEIGK